MGSVGLIAGWLSLGDTAEQLPFGSPVLGGIALAVCVALPATVAAVVAIRRRPWARAMHRATAGVVMVWVVVETLFIGLSSALQPIVFVWGAAILVLGDRPPRRDGLS